MILVSDFQDKLVNEHLSTQYLDEVFIIRLIVGVNGLLVYCSKILVKRQVLAKKTSALTKRNQMSVIVIFIFSKFH